MIRILLRTLLLIAVYHPRLQSRAERVLAIMYKTKL